MCILVARHDRVFLISESGSTCTFGFRHKEDLVLTCDLRQVICTLQYTYIIPTMILTPLENRSFFLWNPSQGVFWCSWLQLSFQSDLEFLLDSHMHFDSFYPILSLRTGNQIWIDDINQSSAAESWCHWEAMWGWETSIEIDHSFWIPPFRTYSWTMSTHYQLWFFYHSQLLLKFQGRNFCKMGRMLYPHS